MITSDIPLSKSYRLRVLARAGSVLVPVAELRSHSVVQIIADAGIAMGELNPLDKILHKPKSLF